MSSDCTPLRNADFRIEAGEFHRQGDQLIRALIGWFQRAGYNVTDASISTGWKHSLAASITGELHDTEVRLEIESDDIDSSPQLDIKVHEAGKQKHQSPWSFTNIEDALQQITRIAEENGGENGESP
ncbi:hypothetical protein [Halorubrum depositum]|uniref:hypothetical protein n=1 Tax=Halorubrum depositum TaxID=2583992 RepID=UPI0011A4FBF4|nr:hypothetical protein [Halorubrum depositum]